MEARELDAMLTTIRGLPFVKSVRAAAGRAKQSPAELRIRSAAGAASFTVEVKRTHLNRAAPAGIAAAARQLVRDGKPPLLLLARYVPRAAGEELVRHGICFADEAGNVNLRLGERYHALVLGHRDRTPRERKRRLSPGTVQMHFVALARPDLLREPVRRLAENAGVGKSTAAEVRRQLLEQRLAFADASGEYRITDEKALLDRFLLGYSEILRPHLFVGRYRGPYGDSGGFIEALEQACSRRALPWALTGGAGAYELDRYYRSEQTVAFVDGWDAALARELRLVPDRAGPVTVLRPFGGLVVWPRPEERPVAHPWLIYAELLHEGEPRSIEVAEELRRNHLR